MNELEERTIFCPYCGEQSSVLIDCSDADQNYIEDCQVCCRPITFFIRIDNDDELSVTVFSENETP